MNKKRNSKIFIASMIAVAMFFSFSSCVKDPDAESSSSGEENNTAEAVYFTKGNEEFSKEGSEVILTENGTLFFLTADGEVYGAGKNSNWELGSGNDYEVTKAIKVR